MRLYTFCNYYLSSIQQGIQSAHCLANMFVRYTHPLSVCRVMLFDWAESHKTMVVLNGGNSSDLKQRYEMFISICKGLEYPYGIFREDVESLQGAITCVGVIVPEKIYKYNEFEQERMRLEVGPLGMFSLNPITLNTAEKELAKIIASAPLAR